MNYEFIVHGTNIDIFSIVLPLSCAFKMGGANYSTICLTFALLFTYLPLSSNSVTGLITKGASKRFELERLDCVSIQISNYSRNSRDIDLTKYRACLSIFCAYEASKFML